MTRTESAIVCPKCRNRQDDRIACHRCGLVFANWTPEREREQFASIPPDILQRAERLWKEVESAPSERETDAWKAFDAFCATAHADLYAAVKYRERLADYPEDEAAVAFQKRLLTRTAMMLPESRNNNEKKTNWFALGLTVLALGAFLAMIAWYLSSNLTFMMPR